MVMVLARFERCRERLSLQKRIVTCWSFFAHHVCVVVAAFFLQDSCCCCFFFVHSLLFSCNLHLYLQFFVCFCLDDVLIDKNKLRNHKWAIGRLRRKEIHWKSSLFFLSLCDFFFSLVFAIWISFRPLCREKQWEKWRKVACSRNSASSMNFSQKDTIDHFI